MWETSVTAGVRFRHVGEDRHDSNAWGALLGVGVGVVGVGVGVVGVGVGVGVRARVRVRVRVRVGSE